MRLFTQTVVFISFCCVNLCHAQTDGEWDVAAWEEVEQHVTAAEITADSMGYRLFDDSILGPHNAASFYYRACLKWAALPKLHRIKLNEKRESWFGSPISKLPTVEVEQWLAETDSVFAELNRGLSGTCDWGISGDSITYSEQVQMDFSVEQAVLNEFGDILRLKARLHAAKAEFGDATKSIAGCIKLARDSGELPVPFYGSTMTSRIAYPAIQLTNELAKMPGSPNLLHALQNLPRPIADYLSDIKLKHRVIQRSFSFLDNPEKSDRTDAQWRAVFLEGINQIDRAHRWNLERKYPNAEKDLAASRHQRLSILFAKSYPVAKRKLIEARWEADELDAMPVGKVIAIQTRRLWDEYTKLHNGIENMPASRVHDRAIEIENSELIYGEVNGCFPLNLIVHAQESLLRSRWQLIEISMNLQLLRDHLAKTGAFPTAEQFKKLNPFPDPDTGLPFQYRRLENGNAQLQSKPVFYDESSSRESYVRVRYTIKKVGK